jgi:hypothetical protein
VSTKNVRTVFAVYRADGAGPIGEDTCSICVALFTDAIDAIREARDLLLDGYSVSIEIGQMTDAAWDALDEVPDDFQFAPPPSTNAVDPSAPHPGTLTIREEESS